MVKRVCAAPEGAFKRFRKALDLSQEDIGAARDVGRSAVQGVERAGASVQLDTLVAYAAPFNVEVRVSFVARCEVCGRHTDAWKVHRFKNVGVLLCSHCDAYQGKHEAPCSVCAVGDEAALAEHIHVPGSVCGFGLAKDAPCGYVPGHSGAHEPLKYRAARGIKAVEWVEVPWVFVRDIDARLARKRSRTDSRG